MRLVIATHNKGKIIEIKKILGKLNLELLGMDEVGIADEIIEDGKTFTDNALKKAEYVARKIKGWSVADDSGISVDALDGAPGVYSARWAGQDVSDQEIPIRLLDRLSKVPLDRRQATFISSVALVSPEGRHWLFEGKVEGSITTELKGKARLHMPYDVIFIPVGYQKTFAEMSHQEKNSLSHRGAAFLKLKVFLDKEFPS